MEPFRDQWGEPRGYRDMLYTSIIVKHELAIVDFNSLLLDQPIVGHSLAIIINIF